MDVEEAIERVRQGCPEAFEFIIEYSQQKLFKYCYYMLRNRQEAEDAVQEILFKAYTKLPDYQMQQDKQLMAWLYTLARNYCSTLLKRRRKLLQLLPLFHHETETTFPEDTGVADPIIDWMMGLTLKERELLILRIVDDLTFEEISILTGIRNSALRKRFERIKKKLRLQKSREERTVYEQRLEH